MASMRIFLYSKWGFYLQINAEQQSISGVRTNDEHCVLEMKRTDFGKVKKVTIQGVNANAYIAVNAEGDLYTTANEDESCIWREIQHDDGYYYYESDVYNRFYLGIKREGAPENARRTALEQVGCAFVTKPAA